MSTAKPLPRKYLSILLTTQEELQTLARRARAALDALEGDKRCSLLTRMVLRDVEAEAYRLALDLAGLEVSGTCDGCPSAPPATESQALLLVLANELERQAAAARAHVHKRSEVGLLPTNSVRPEPSSDEKHTPVNSKPHSSLDRLRQKGGDAPAV